MTKKLVKKQASLPAMPSFSEFDRIFDEFREDMEKSFFALSRTDFPKFPETTCDVIDEGKQLRVKMSVPGVTKKEVALSVTDTAIDIRAEHKEESEEKKKNFLRKERSNVSYKRILPLPDKIIPARVKSKLTDGILEIILPKAKPTKIQKKRTVRVQ